jgi:hypothetical protein
MAEEHFPSNYESWRYCIEVKCGLALTPDYIKKRITILGDPHCEESQRFISFYGDPCANRYSSGFNALRQRHKNGTCLILMKSGCSGPNYCG